MRTVCLVLLLLAACREKQGEKAAPAPAPAVETTEPAPAPAKPAETDAIKPAGGFNTAAEYEAKVFTITDKLAEVFGGTGTNCEKLADRLEVFVDENKKLFEDIDAFEVANPQAMDVLDDKMQKQSKVLIDKITLTMQTCKDNKRVLAAVAKLPD